MRSIRRPRWACKGNLKDCELLAEILANPTKENRAKIDQVGMEVLDWVYPYCVYANEKGVGTKANKYLIHVIDSKRNLPQKVRREETPSPKKRKKRSKRARKPVKYEIPTKVLRYPAHVGYADLTPALDISYDDLTLGSPSSLTQNEIELLVDRADLAANRANIVGASAMSADMTQEARSVKGAAITTRKHIDEVWRRFGNQQPISAQMIDALINATESTENITQTITEKLGGIYEGEE